MDGEEIKSLEEFISIIDKLKFEYSNSKMGVEFSYRGISDQTYELLPSIYRKATCKKNNIKNSIYYNSEIEILSHFVKESCVYIDRLDLKDYLNWMIYAQHFGAPTRLLDFSSNPLIALYFSCKENPEVDGAVWIFNNTNYMEFLKRNSDYLKDNKFTKSKIMEDIIQNVMDKKISCIEYPFVHIPYYIDTRMAAQESRFLIWGSKQRCLDNLINESDFMVINDKGIVYQGEKEERFLFKVKVPGERKYSILKQLYSAGVNEKKLFPGLDGVGLYISNYYRMTYDDYVNLL